MLFFLLIIYYKYRKFVYSDESSSSPEYLLEDCKTFKNTLKNDRLLQIKHIHNLHCCTYRFSLLRGILDLTFISFAFIFFFDFPLMVVFVVFCSIVFKSKINVFILLFMRTFYIETLLYSFVTFTLIYDFNLQCINIFILFGKIVLNKT